MGHGAWGMEQRAEGGEQYTLKEEAVPFFMRTASFENHINLVNHSQSGLPKLSRSNNRPTFLKGFITK
jgi:hypothetical protein